MEEPEDPIQADERGDEPSLAGEISPIPGMDWRTFQNYVLRALTGDDSVPTSILARVGAAVERGERDLEQRDGRWWRDFFWNHMLSQSLAHIDEGIGELERMAGWYREQAAKMRNEMDEIGRRMGERDEFIAEVTDINNGWIKDGKLDRERAIEALRKRGVDANDRMSDAQILALLRDNQQRALEEQERDSKRYDHLDKWQGEFDREAEELEKRARAYLEERDRIMDEYGPDLTDEQRAERQRRLDELEERVGKDVVHAGQKLEENQAEREAERLESETSRDISKDVDDRNPFMALADNFAAQADPNQPRASTDDGLRKEAVPISATPAAPGVEN